MYALVFYLFVLIFGSLPGFVFGQDGIIVTAVALKIVYDLKHNPTRYLLGIIVGKIDRFVTFLNKPYPRKN